ncbi:MAG: hypothetical protein AAFP68_16395 [Pseudomonadota bacterium]
MKTLLAGIPGVVKVVGIRTHHLNASELPAIQITTPSEAIEPLDSSHVNTRRRVQVDVAVWAVGDEGIDDEIDTIAATIEQRILTATGEPWDSMILHFPTGATMALGETAKETAVVLTTRFTFDFQASTPETIGD